MKFQVEEFRGRSASIISYNNPTNCINWTPGMNKYLLLTVYALDIFSIRVGKGAIIGKIRLNFGYNKVIH